MKRLVVAGEATFGLTDTDDANEALKDGADVEVVYPDADELGTLVMPTSVVLIANGRTPRPGRLGRLPAVGRRGAADGRAAAHIRCTASRRHHLNLSPDLRG